MLPEEYTTDILWLISLGLAYCDRYERFSVDRLRELKAWHADMVFDRQENTCSNHPEYQKAMDWAKRNGIIGKLYRIEDRCGGYWQCSTKYGVYNFRVD